jgi:hypothetical protein
MPSGGVQYLTHGAYQPAHTRSKFSNSTLHFFKDGNSPGRASPKILLIRHHSVNYTNKCTHRCTCRGGYWPSFLAPTTQNHFAMPPIMTSHVDCPMGRCRGYGPSPWPARVKNKGTLTGFRVSGCGVDRPPKKKKKFGYRTIRTHP